MHRPSTFNDMLQLAERADQAFMSDRNGVLNDRGSRGYSNFGRGGMNIRGGQRYNGQR